MKPGTTAEQVEEIVHLLQQGCDRAAELDLDSVYRHASAALKLARDEVAFTAPPAFAKGQWVKFPNEVYGVVNSGRFETEWQGRKRAEYSIATWPLDKMGATIVREDQLTAVDGPPDYLLEGRFPDP